MKYRFYLFLFCILLLCSCEAGQNIQQRRFFPQSGLPDLPSFEELDTMRESDCLGTYTGEITVLMDGKSYGPYTETLTISKHHSSTLRFVSPKVVYKVMPIDIGYTFDALSLSPAENRLFFRLNGKKGRVIGYGKNDNKPFDVGTNAEISGVIYKKKDDGKVYLSFTVTYDTDEIKKAFPVIPEGSHNSMSSTMKAGIKTAKP